jgi:mycoredoxin
MAHDLVLYSTTWCGACAAVKRALGERGVAYREIDCDADVNAAATVEALNDGRRSVPTLVHGSQVVNLARFSLPRLDTFLTDAGLR